MKEGNLKFLDVITELNGIPYTLESEFQESVLPKSLVQLTLKRPYTVPSVKKLLSEGKLGNMYYLPGCGSTDTMIYSAFYCSEIKVLISYTHSGAPKS